jgi:hypothetical protein
MKFIKFNDWLNKINEETREERARRELEAERREDIFMKHMDQEKQNKNAERAAGFSGYPETDEKMKKYIDFRKSLPNIGESPSQEFVDSVCDNVEKKTNFSYMYDFPDNPKGEADSDRILELVHDCFHDGTSEEEATNMVIDLLRQMKYVR